MEKSFERQPGENATLAKTVFANNRNFTKMQKKQNIPKFKTINTNLKQHNPFDTFNRSNKIAAFQTMSIPSKGWNFCSILIANRRNITQTDKNINIVNSLDGKCQFSLLDYDHRIRSPLTK
ncbi:cyclic nucleotide-gated cation channel beta-3 [Trichinella spiralis]|uniref:cyclic nucleotide-gated cation channel beta-3 n=1 Tax=Trichinella spiralis TaxID=6334 RepID=UPI0001EFEC3D|nr:cyclic nucleotide-gated cation channel beta-3 [Trichinella spiralis]